MRLKNDNKLELWAHWWDCHVTVICEMLWRGLKGWTYEHGDMSKTDGQSGLHDPKLPSHLRPKFLGSFLGQQKIRDFMKPLLNLNLWYLIDENSWGFIKILLILLQVLVLNKKSAMFIILFIHILHFGDSYTLLTRSQPCVSSFLDLVTSFQQRGWNGVPRLCRK